MDYFFLEKRIISQDILSLIISAILLSFITFFVHFFFKWRKVILQRIFILEQQFETETLQDGNIDDNEESDSDDELYHYDMSEEDMDIEDDHQRLVLDVLFNTMPNLWLKPELRSMDYVFSLPTWKCLYQAISCNEVSDYTTCSSDEHTSEENYQISIERTDLVIINKSNNIIQEQCCTIESQKIVPTNDIDSTYAITSPSSNESVIQQKTLRRRRRKRRGFLKQSNKSSTGQLSDVDNAFQERPPIWMIETHNCTFCLEDYCRGDELCGLPCGHNFHLNCLAEWFRRDQRCPVCRWPSYRFNHPRHRTQSFLQAT